MRLDNKIAVVTGAASGIGLAIAGTLARAGAHVVIGDLAKDKGEEAAKGLRDQKLSAEYAYLDVTSDDAVKSFAADVLKKHGRVDILVNNAGWGRIEFFTQNPPDFWDKVVAINFMGTVRMCHAFLPSMNGTKGAHIVNVASDAGRVGSMGEAVYSGAKGGVIAFSKALAREGARSMISVNCVCPGPTDTPLLAAVPEKHREAFARATPFRRFAKPEEIADAVLFFASDRASFVTGQVLSVSGGLTMAG
jgi:2-hydroxycyclohexanecarboxyl-CoA dehydrogenase